MLEGVDTLTADKDRLRRYFWQALEEAHAARFPGAWGRIPNFVGAERAAGRLRATDAWRDARVIKCNPDAPQLPVRSAALEDGKLVYMAVPRLRNEACFIELDPVRLGGKPREAASIQGAIAHGRPVEPADVPPIDLVVCGSVSACADGSRMGKGGGYSDLEYALLAELGKITDRTRVATTVHPAQLSYEPLPMHSHDVPLDYIATPAEVIECADAYPQPGGIYWDLLPRERIREIPVLHRLWTRLSQGSLASG